MPSFERPRRQLISTSRETHLAITNKGRSSIIPGYLRKWAKRFNSVQKAFKSETKSKVGINEGIVTAKRQLQTSDQGLRAISASISAASPEKMDRNAKF